MLPTVAVVVRYPHHHALAASWDVIEGTLALPVEVPPPGGSVLIDGMVGEVCFLLGGTVVAGPGGRRLVQVAAEGRPLVEALILPPCSSSAARRVA
ncbi:hypothetical protein [Vulgatibacter sp.]|uniref:hypothetical protein n=1 Tax=Vulgatibacter sp. TaxID=1971226 RepID=UPI0035681B83